MRNIVSTTCTNSGSPRIDGTRLTCANVTQGIWYRCGCSLDEYLADYPYLDRVDLVNCLQYCASQKCVAENVHSFCEQCTLEKRPADPALAKKYDDFALDSSDANEREDVWKLANELLRRYS